MSHYFITDESLPENRKEISFRFLGTQYSLLTMAGTFSKDALDYGTRVLLENTVNLSLKGPILDLGTGNGVVGVVIKQAKPELEVVMSDVNARCVEVAAENVKNYHQNSQVILSDGFEKITEKFGTILLNPPIRAGKKVIYRLFQESYQHINPQGSLYVVIRKDQGANSALKELSQYFKVSLIAKDRGYQVLWAVKDIDGLQ